MAIGRITKILLRVLSVFHFCYFSKHFLYIAPTRTRDISWCPGLTQPRHHNFTSVHLGVLNGCSRCTTLSEGTHDIRRRWVAFVLPSLNPVKGLLHGNGQKGGASLKVGWSIFGNTEMYHLCVQYIYISTRDESALGPVVPLDGRRGCIRDALPVIEVVGELIVRYHRTIEYKSYFYGFQQNAFPKKCFSTKGFSTKCFPRNAGKPRWGKSKES